MWRKKKDPLLELLGYESDQDLVTADDVLMQTVNGITSGNLEVLVEACQLQSIKKEDLAGASGIVKGHASNYIRKFFAKSSFHVVEIEENADETIAAVHLKGETVSAEEMVEQAITILERNEATLQLFSGNMDMRKISMAMDLVGEIITGLRTAPVTGVVHMEKTAGKWQMVNNDELSQVMARSSVTGLEQMLLERYGKMFQKKNG